MRLAAGRARALGVPTRGTTNPNRLRRMDRWITATLGPALRAAADPVVVDLGFGAGPATTVELLDRLSAVRPDVRVVGVEIDAERVAAAQPAAGERLRFVLGGFELAGLRPVLVRAANVLRQYDEASAAAAWTTLRAGLADGGALVEGTCDELGRRGSWVLLDAAGPRSLTLACRIGDITTPGDLAARLPKALIHHNVAGHPVHTFLQALDAAWRAAAPVSTFGPAQRWVAMCQAVAADWPVLDRRARWRHGEITVSWTAVAPTG